MQSRVVFGFRCFAVVALCAAVAPLLAYDGEDYASNYTTTWNAQKKGTGFATWQLNSYIGTSYDIIASAAGYGGDAAALDTGGKSFILNMSQGSTIGEVTRYISASLADGMKFGMRIQVPAGSFSIAFYRSTGRYGTLRVRPAGWELTHGTESINIDLSPTAPVEILVTGYGSTNKWDFVIRDIQTHDMRTYTGLDSIGSGQLTGFFIEASANSATTGTVLFNSLIVDPTGAYSKVDEALKY